MTITLDLLDMEKRIALFMFCDEFVVADALRDLVQDCGGELSEHRIELEIDEIRRERSSRGK